MLSLTDVIHVSQPSTHKRTSLPSLYHNSRGNQGRWRGKGKRADGVDLTAQGGWMGWDGWWVQWYTEQHLLAEAVYDA